MKGQQLTQKESAIAAENHYLINQFLEANNLPEDDYYDVVVFGYLKAVRNFSKNKNLSLRTEAMKEMNAACVKFERAYESDIALHSLQEVIDGIGILEESIASVKNTVNEALERIQYETLSKDFDRLQMQIADMLVAGYPKREIANMLGINMKTLTDKISEMQGILTPGVCMAA